MKETLRLFIEREKVRLKNFVVLSPEEARMVLSWRNHPTVASFMFRRSGISLREHREFLESLKEKDTDFYFLVYGAGAPLGVIYLNRVDRAHGEAEIGLYRNPFLKRSAGTTLLRALEEVARSLSLRRLWARVLPSNRRAIRLYRKHGYRLYGETPDFFLYGKEA